MQTALVATNAVLFWPTNATGFVLQSTPELALDTLWTDLTITPVQAGEWLIVTDSISGFARFYRLCITN